MNWPLNAQTDGAFFGRQVFHHEMFAKSPRTVNDDVWTFNSQSSSQWDGLRHYAYQREGLFYNGVGMGDIHGGVVKVRGEGDDGKEGGKSTVNGIQGECDRFSWELCFLREMAKVGRLANDVPRNSLGGKGNRRPWCVGRLPFLANEARSRGGL